MSSRVGAAAQGTIYFGAAQLALALAGYVVAVVLARALGPVEFGYYGTVYSLLITVEVIALIGLPSAVSLLIAQRGVESRRIVGTAMALALAASLIGFIALWVTADLLAERLSIQNGARLIRIAAIDLPFFSGYMILSHVLTGYRDFPGQSLGTFLYAAIKVVGTLALPLFGPTIALALIVNVLASVGGLAALALRAGEVPLWFDRESAKKLLWLSLPIASIVAGSNLLLYIDVWAVSAVDPGNGYYIAAKNLARLPNFVAFVAHAVLLPSIAHAAAQQDTESVRRLIRGAMQYLAFALIPGCALMAVEARGLMELLFSVTYVDGARYLPLLVAANGLLYTVFSVLLSILIALGRQRTALIAAALVLIPAVAANLILVRVAGGMGAAAAAALSCGLAVLIAGYRVVRQAGWPLRLSELLRVLIVTGVVTVATSAVTSRGAGLIVELALACLAVLAGLLLTGVLKVQEIRQLFDPRGRS